jgi:hypothetical protein
MLKKLTKSKIGFALAILFAISLFLIRGGDRYSGLFGSDNVVASVQGLPFLLLNFFE